MNLSLLVQVKVKYLYPLSLHEPAVLQKERYVEIRKDENSVLHILQE